MFIAHDVSNHTKLRRSGMRGCNGDMPPRWGWHCFSEMGFYKRVAPLGLGLPYRPPGAILKVLSQLKAKIQQGTKELEGMLK